LIASLWVTPKLLVHDQQPEVFETDVVGEQPVGADHDVHRSVGQSTGDHPGLLRGEEPRQHLDPDRVAGETLAEGLVVLGGEQRRRHQDCYLLAVLHRLESGAYRHLRLAEPDVAADQPVHRPRLFHVGFHLGDSLQLVGRLVVGERLLELALPGRVSCESVPGRADPLLVEDHQLLGDLPDRAAHPGLRALPFGAVEPVQRGALAAGVRAEQVHLVGRYVQLVAALVLEEQVVALDAADGAAHHPTEAAHPVLVVHHVGAGGQVVEKGLGAAGPPAGPAVRSAPAGQVTFGEHGDLERRPEEPALEALHPQVDPRVGQAALVTGVQPVVVQHRGQTGSAPLALGADDDPVALRAQRPQLGHEPLASAADRVPPGRRDHRRARPFGSRGERPRGGLGPGQQPVERQVQPGEGVASGTPRLG
jgi:hypothetical protein